MMCLLKMAQARRIYIQDSNQGMRCKELRPVCSKTGKNLELEMAMHNFQRWSKMHRRLSLPHRSQSTRMTLNSSSLLQLIPPMADYSNSWAGGGSSLKDRHL